MAVFVDNNMFWLNLLLTDADHIVNPKTVKESIFWFGNFRSATIASDVM